MEPNQIVVPLVNGALHIDNSSLEKFVTCPRSGQYYYFNKREAAGSRPALAFGGIIHKALEVRYRNLRLPAEHVLPLMLECLAEEFENYTPPEGDHRTYQFATDVICRYMDTYPVEDFEPAFMPDGTQLIESSFAIPLGAVSVEPGQILVREGNGPSHPYEDKILPVVWTGRIDLGYRREGKLFLMDHKTTSVMGSTYWQSFDLSHAVHGYSWALKKLIGEQPFGYVINALGLRKPTKTGKSIELERKSVFLSTPHLDEWEEDTLFIVTTILQQVAWNYMPKHTAWCVGKFGACPYFDVCSMPPESRNAVLFSGNYKDVTWSPHNENGAS